MKSNVNDLVGMEVFLGDSNFLNKSGKRIVFLRHEELQLDLLLKWMGQPSNAAALRLKVVCKDCRGKIYETWEKPLIVTSSEQKNTIFEKYSFNLKSDQYFLEISLYLPNQKITLEVDGKQYKTFSKEFWIAPDRPQKVGFYVAQYLEVLSVILDNIQSDGNKELENIQAKLNKLILDPQKKDFDEKKIDIFVQGILVDVLYKKIDDKDWLRNQIEGAKKLKKLIEDIKRSNTLQEKLKKLNELQIISAAIIKAHLIERSEQKSMIVSDSKRDIQARLERMEQQGIQPLFDMGNDSVKAPLIQEIYDWSQDISLFYSRKFSIKQMPPANNGRMHYVQGWTWDMPWRWNDNEWEGVKHEICTKKNSQGADAKIGVIHMRLSDNGVDRESLQKEIPQLPTISAAPQGVSSENFFQIKPNTSYQISFRVNGKIKHKDGNGKSYQGLSFRIYLAKSAYVFSFPILTRYYPETFRVIPRNWPLQNSTALNLNLLKSIKVDYKNNWFEFDDVLGQIEFSTGSESFAKLDVQLRYSPGEIWISHISLREVGLGTNSSPELLVKSGFKLDNRYQLKSKGQSQSLGGKCFQPGKPLFEEANDYHDFCVNAKRYKDGRYRDILRLAGENSEQNRRKQKNYFVGYANPARRQSEVDSMAFSVSKSLVFPAFSRVVLTSDDYSQFLGPDFNKYALDAIKDWVDSIIKQYPQKKQQYSQILSKVSSLNTKYFYDDPNKNNNILFPDMIKRFYESSKFNKPYSNRTSLNQSNNKKEFLPEDDAWLLFSRFWIEYVWGDYGYRASKALKQDEVKVGPIPGNQHIPALYALYGMYPPLNFGDKGFSLTSYYYYNNYWQPVIANLWWAECARVSAPEQPLWVVTDGHTASSPSYFRQVGYSILAAGADAMLYFNSPISNFLLKKEAKDVAAEFGEITNRLGLYLGESKPRHKKVGLFIPLEQLVHDEQAAVNLFYAFTNLLFAQVDIEPVFLEILSSKSHNPYDILVLSNINHLTKNTLIFLEEYSKKYGTKILIDDSSKAPEPNNSKRLDIKVFLEVGDEFPSAPPQKSKKHLDSSDKTSSKPKLQFHLDSYNQTLHVESLVSSLNNKDILNYLGRKRIFSQLYVNDRDYIVRPFEINGYLSVWILNCQSSEDFFDMRKLVDFEQGGKQQKVLKGLFLSDDDADKEFSYGKLQKINLHVPDGTGIAFDALSQIRLTSKVVNNEDVIDVSVPKWGAALVVFFPSEPKLLKVYKSLGWLGRKLQINIQVLDSSGSRIDAPFQFNIKAEEIHLRGVQKNREYSGRTFSENGDVTYTVEFASNDFAGLWKFTIEEPVTGIQAMVCHFNSYGPLSNILSWFSPA